MEHILQRARREWAPDFPEERAEAVGARSEVELPAPPNGGLRGQVAVHHDPAGFLWSNADTNAWAQKGNPATPRNCRASVTVVTQLGRHPATSLRSRSKQEGVHRP
jgi:hypothetical protein